jgi:hypothetical protein
VSISIHIPPKNSGFFTLFAQGNIIHANTLSEGTFLSVGGVAALFYKYPHCRRAYLVKNAADLLHYPPVALPNVGQKVGILFKARGRQIDLLHKTLYFLMQTAGVRVFLYKPIFWQRIACLIESCEGHYSPLLKERIFTLRNRYLLENKYGKIKGA